MIFFSRPTLAIYNKHKRQNISTPPNIGKQQLPNASAVIFFVCSLDPSGNKASHSSAGGGGGGEGGKKLRGGERILTLKNGSKRKEFFMSKPKKRRRSFIRRRKNLHLAADKHLIIKKSWVTWSSSPRGPNLALSQVPRTRTPRRS